MRGLGRGGQTGIGVCALHRLRQAVLGDPGYRVKVHEPYQMLGEMDDALREALGLDVVGVPTPGTMFGYRAEGWKPFTMLDGTPVSGAGAVQRHPRRQRRLADVSRGRYGRAALRVDDR